MAARLKEFSRLVTAVAIQPDKFIFLSTGRSAKDELCSMKLSLYPFLAVLFDY
jgi:hypothetical protein